MVAPGVARSAIAARITESTRAVRRLLIPTVAGAARTRGRRATETALGSAAADWADAATTIGEASSARTVSIRAARTNRGMSVFGSGCPANVRDGHAPGNRA